MNPVFDCFNIRLVANSSREFHSHKFDELYLGTCGEAVQVTESKRVLCREGDIFWFPAGVSHVAEPQLACECIVIYFEDSLFHSSSYGESDVLNFIRLLRKQAMNGDYCLVFNEASADRARTLIAELLEIIRSKSSGYRPLAKTRLIEFFTLAATQYPGLIEQAESFYQDLNAAKIESAMRYAEVHCTEPLAIEELSSIASLSRSHFHALFRKLTGETFVQYLNRIRVEKAADLIREGIPIQQASMRCGFKSLSHFYRFFKRRFGCPPKAFAAKKSRR